VLPYALSAASAIFDDYIQRGKFDHQLVTYLLHVLVDLRVPQQSFRQGKLQFSEHSPLQSELGVVMYLMPQLSKMIMTENYEMRKQLQLLLTLVSEYLLNS
jgi:hypothetical protein